ncbi:MAG TPA: hypothetical protein VHW95_04985 [Steroidobacteraceae bacterium]|jgi:hypothetical protein|nr:hypothetical protein [Steroidobacteraceae bacterium]
MMNRVPRGASREKVLEIVRGWVDVLAAQDYQTAFEKLGYSISSGDSSFERITRAIQCYRSPDYYPGVTTFIVSDWRTARGGKPDPQQKVIWYKPNTVRMAGAVAFDLPLNGGWSDLTADFVFFENDNPDAGYILRLEEIHSWRQTQREMEAQERTNS